jgi:hypothetical protein
MRKAILFTLCASLLLALTVSCGKKEEKKASPEDADEFQMRLESEGGETADSQAA